MTARLIELTYRDLKAEAASRAAVTSQVVRATQLEELMSKQMKAIIIGVAIMLACVVGASAQNVAAIFGNAFDDTPLPPHPCGSVGLKGSVQITTLTNRVLALYTCTDDRVIARQFVQPVVEQRIDDGPAIPPRQR
jgi:hypothetical protein